MQSPITFYPRLAVSRRSSSTKTVTRVPRRVRTSRKVTVSVKQAADFCSCYLHRLPVGGIKRRESFQQRWSTFRREPFKSCQMNREILSGGGGEPRPSSRGSKQQSLTDAIWAMILQREIRTRQFNDIIVLETSTNLHSLGSLILYIHLVKVQLKGISLHYCTN